MTRWERMVRRRGSSQAAERRRGSDGSEGAETAEWDGLEFTAKWLERHRVDVSGVTEESIVGISHVVREIRSLVGRLKHPEVVLRAGAELPRGILFYGPPGTGKTLTARHLAAQLGADVPMFELSSDEVSPSRARQTLRHLSERYERSVLYIDEIDGFALDRKARQQSPRTRAVLVAFLAALDGLIESRGPIVIASSNRDPFELDDALTRAGRLGFHVEFDKPNEEERMQLLELFVRPRQVTGPIDWRRMAELSRGQTPADLRQALDDALGLALVDGREAITSADVLAALGRHGRIEPEPLLDEADRQRSAIHEAGHVAAAVALEGPGFVYSVVLDPLGNGSTRVGEERRLRISPSDRILWAKVVIAYAGLAAEQSLGYEPALTADSDIETATQVVLSRISGGLDPVLPPLDPDGFELKLAEATKARIASAAEEYAVEGRRRAAEIVAANREAISRFAALLLERRQLTGVELQQAIVSAGFAGPVVEHGRVDSPGGATEFS